MANFNHFIITRFNLKQTIWVNDKLGDTVNDEHWLNERFALFEQYCFPSIKNQTEKQFKWLVYFDSDTPGIFKQKNEHLQRIFKSYIPIYVASFSEFETKLPQTICELKEATKNYVITTRLDNDDAFHKDAVKVIQNHFIEEDKTIIDLANGLALKINGEYKLSLKKNVISGPFISLIEKIDPLVSPLTVYDREHTSWHGIAAFRTVDEGYYWLQLIHNRNISNGLSNNLTFNTSYLKGFDFLNPIHFSIKYYVFIILKRLKLLSFIKRNLNN